MTKLFFVLCFIVLSNIAFADVCPTPKIIKDREISRDYEWTLDERKTLDDVLAVEQLYSVRIKNNGEFVACYYSSPRGLLRLDGKPEKEGCSLKIKQGNWASLETGEAICKEEKLALCHYEISCGE